MNGKGLQQLKAYCQEHETSLDMIMQVLHLADFDNQVIDYLSDGLWSRKQRIIGLDLSAMYPTRRKP